RGAGGTVCHEDRPGGLRQSRRRVVSRHPGDPEHTLTLRSPAMLSTMMHEQLSVSTILQFGATVHKDAVVTTWTESGPRKVSFGDIGKRSAQLAHALRALGIDGDQRVATFQWNNSEHMEAYLAIPSMGAVLHPLN